MYADMNLTSPAQRVGTILGKLEDLGAEMPELTAAHDTYARRMSALDEAISAANRDAAGLVASLDAEDLLSSPGALRLATAQIVAQRREAFEAAAAVELQDALRTSTPDVIRSLQDAFAAEVDRVRSAAPVLEGTPLDEPGAVLALGGTAAEAYLEVTAADKRLGAVLFTVSLLEDAGLYPRVGGKFTLASRFAGDLPADWLVLTRLGITPQMKPSDVILRTGARLRLMSGKERLAWSERVQKSYDAMDLRDGAATDAAQGRADAFLAGAR